MKVFFFLNLIFFKESRVPRDRVRHTLDLLVTRGPTSFKIFIEALVLTGNAHIARELDADYCDSEACKLLIESEARYSIEATTTTTSPPIINTNTTGVIYHKQTLTPGSYLLSTTTTNSNCNGTHRLLSPCTVKIEEEKTTATLITNRTRSPHQSQIITPQMMKIRHKSPSPATLIRPSSSSQQIITHSPKYPIAVASCQFSPNCVLNSPNGSSSNTNSNNGYIPFTTYTNEIFIAPSPVVKEATNTNKNYSHDDTLDILGHEALIPLNNSNNDIGWDDINELDLDFEVKTVANNNFDDFTDECNHVDTRYYQNNNECYPMEREPRGICLIINNEHFYDNEHNELIELRRYGTDMDASRLKTLFEKLKFNVICEYDLTEKELRQSIQQFATDCDHNSNNYDAVCLIVLSHGTDGYIYGTDFENKINVCPHLTLILSLFFIHFKILFLDGQRYFKFI